MKNIRFIILFIAYGIAHFSCAQILNMQLIDKKIKALDSNYTKKNTIYCILGIQKLKYQAKSKDDYEIGTLQYNDSKEDSLKIDSVLQVTPPKYFLDVDLGTGVVNLHSGIPTDIICIRFAYKQDINFKAKNIKKTRRKLRKKQPIQKTLIRIDNVQIPYKEAYKIIKQLKTEEIFCIESKIGYITKKYRKKFILCNVWITTNYFVNN